VTARLFASAPPIVGALFLQDLGVILQVSGLFGTYVALFTPAFLVLAARSWVRNNGLELQFSSDSSSSGVFRRIEFIALIIFLALAAVVFVVKDLFP
jgi:hypothetical protein